MKERFLKVKLTKEDIKLIRGIIWNTRRKYFMKYFEENRKINKFIDINDVEDLFFVYDKYNSIEEKIADNFEYIYSEFCNDDGKDLMIGLFNKIAKDIGIIKYIAPLTMNEKLVVFLYYLATLNGSEIGRKMNKSRQCVNESMRNAIKKIKKEISKNEQI